MTEEFAKMSEQQKLQYIDKQIKASSTVVAEPELSPNYWESQICESCQ